GEHEIFGGSIDSLNRHRFAGLRCVGFAAVHRRKAHGQNSALAANGTKSEEQERVTGNNYPRDAKNTSKYWMEATHLISVERVGVWHAKCSKLTPRSGLSGRPRSR